MTRLILKNQAFIFHRITSKKPYHLPAFVQSDIPNFPKHLYLLQKSWCDEFLFVKVQDVGI
jgi:hypothetical protein